MTGLAIRGFNNKKYDDFYKDAEVLAATKNMKGAKLITVGTGISYSSPGLGQGTQRTLMSLAAKVFDVTAGGTETSQRILEWSMALQSKVLEFRINDAQVFEDAAEALKMQVSNYNDVAVKTNYQNAAKNVVLFIRKMDELVLSYVARRQRGRDECKKEDIGFRMSSSLPRPPLPPLPPLPAQPKAADAPPPYSGPQSAGATTV